jgi:exosome complex component RRP43
MVESYSRISANPLDSSQLCISPGKAVWALYIDVVCINYDGNALDAAIVAIVSALQNSILFHIVIFILSD